MKPYDHQNDCLTAVNSERQNGAHEALIVMAPGTGKTATAAFDVKKFLAKLPIATHSKKVLYLCHQNDILHQAEQTFKTITGENEIEFGFFNGTEKNLGAKYLFASFQTIKENLT